MGDTDEWGHIGDFSKYIEALRFNDAFIGSIYEKFHNTHTIIVTADHGRAKDWKHHGYDVESQRTWLFAKGKFIDSNTKLDKLSDILPHILYLKSKY